MFIPIPIFFSRGDEQSDAGFFNLKKIPYWTPDLKFPNNPRSKPNHNKQMRTAAEEQQ